MLSKARDVVLAVSALLFVGVVFYFVQFRFDPRPIIDVAEQTSVLLEAVYTEGFASPELKYDDPVLNERKVFITTDLDENAAYRVMRELAYLDAMKPGQPIDLFIETDGGRGGIMLANFLQTLKSPVNTTALDFCASAGTEVLASGTGIRAAFPSSRLIVHIIIGDVYPEDHSDYDFMILQEKVNAAFWGKFSSIPERIYSETNEVFINLDAEQALEFGIIDKILD